MGKLSIWPRAISESRIKKIESRLKGVPNGNKVILGVTFWSMQLKIFQIMPQSFYLNVHVKRDLEQESKLVLEI